jgi:hypothetical protein
MRRSWLLMLCLAGGLSAAGCTDHGTYTVSWQFLGGEPARTGCGLHGVDGIRVTGSSTEGDHEDVVALCTDGGLAHSVPVGSWTFMVNQLDVRGRMIEVSDGGGAPLPAPTAVAVIAEDATVSLDPEIVDLNPRPACGDGIDNDRDGRVDLDDPECARDDRGTAE